MNSIVTRGTDVKFVWAIIEKKFLINHISAKKENVEFQLKDMNINNIALF